MGVSLKYSAVYKGWQVAALIAVLIFLPSLIYVISTRTSMAPGLLATAAFLVLMFSGYLTRAVIPTSWLIGIMIFFATVSVTLATTDNVALFKAVGSMAMLFFFLLFAALLHTVLTRTDYSALSTGLKTVFGLLLLLAALAIVSPIPIGNYVAEGCTAACGRRVFPFSEPSHFALVAGPVYATMLVVLRPKLRKYVYFAAVIQAALFPSVIMSIFLLVLLFVSVRPFVLLSLILVSVTAVMVIFESVSGGMFDYFSSRLFFSVASNNPSTLVFLQGWLDAYRAMVETAGLGWGFQMLGTQSPNIYAVRIFEILHTNINQTDGGAGLAAKLIAECGIVGLIVSLFIFVRIIISAHKLRQFLLTRNKVATEVVTSELYKNAVAHAIIAAFAVEFLVRNLGYFSPGVVMFFVACLQIRRSTGSSQSLAHKKRFHSFSPA